ncbi:hypothetical protein ABZ754_27435 [Micromonospora purpureochromogenes]|uniref:hypothetical protein n=1 Tax=Micromonospora purpureochromogenes TaxID=47872 RepID=UPI0033C874EA
MTVSPVVTPVELRPRRTWFIIAALVAVGGVLAAAGVMLFVLRSGGDLGQRLTPGQVVTVHLSLAEEKMVWVKETGQSVPDVRCDASPVDGQEILEFRRVYLLSENVELNVDNERWRGLLTLSAGPAGRYDASCQTSGVGPAPTLSIGDPPRFYDARDTALGSLAAFGPASISVITGGVLAAVVAVRRGLHRARLRQQSADANHG